MGLVRFSWDSSTVPAVPLHPAKTKESATKLAAHSTSSIIHKHRCFSPTIGYFHNIFSVTINLSNVRVNKGNTELLSLRLQFQLESRMVVKSSDRSYQQSRLTVPLSKLLPVIKIDV